MRRATGVTVSAGRLGTTIDAERQPEKMQVLTERTAELEWLFSITGKLKGAADEKRVIEELLRAAAERLNCAFAVLCVPEKRICVEHGLDPSQLFAWRRKALALGDGRAGFWGGGPSGQVRAG